jgi:hypothetical protein
MRTNHLTAKTARAFVVAHLGLQGLSAEPGQGQKSVVHVTHEGTAPEVSLRIRGASGAYGWHLKATDYLDMEVKNGTQHFSRKTLADPDALNVFVRVAPVPLFYILTEAEIGALVLQSYTREGAKRGDKPGQFTRLVKDSPHDTTYDRHLEPYKVEGTWDKVWAVLGITTKQAAAGQTDSLSVVRS